MYTRDFGNIRSEGTLYNMERGYYSEPSSPPENEQSAEPERKARPGGLLGSLRELKLDDLLIIAIGLLLLLDSESENDRTALLIAALLLL